MEPYPSRNPGVSAPDDRRCDYVIYVDGFRMQCSKYKHAHSHHHDPRTAKTDEMFAE